MDVFLLAWPYLLVAIALIGFGLVCRRLNDQLIITDPRHPAAKRRRELLGEAGRSVQSDRR